MKPVLLSITLLLSCAALAHAARFAGPTSQDAGVRLRTDDAGRIARAHIGWRTVCSDRKTFKSGTTFLPPYDRRTRTRLYDEGDYRVRLDNGERVRVHAWVRARRASARKWTGRFGASAVVRRDGRVVARCKTGTVSWRATRR